MNDAVRVPTDGFLTTADLAARPDFTLGWAAVSPSARTITGPGGSTLVEPRVMQVLVVLAGSVGHVVTRETLFQRCWGGVYVGDDSLNRAVASIRKLASDIADRSFEIETIPRTGYRLTGDSHELVSADASVHESTPTHALSRRAVIGASAAAGTVALGGAAIWWSARPREDPHFLTIMDRVNDQMLKETADENTAKLIERAIAIRPDSAKAWGLLALLKTILAPGSNRKDAGRLLDECEKAARRALELDPKQPDALLAMFELQGSTLDWITRDRRLRQIVAIDPNHMLALTELAALTAATGLVRESWGWNERALALEPLSSDCLGKRALKLWVFGRTPQADKVSDQLRALYPSDWWSWWVRAQIYAFTGRVRAALGMLDSEPRTHGTSPMANLLRASLPAFDNASDQNIAKAREACIGAADGGMAANEAVLIMSYLRQLDTAFDIANASLLSRGPLVWREQPGTDATSANAGWRVNTQWMWVPPVAAMRADPRFLPLCSSIGLKDYWRARRVKPDYMDATS